MPDLQAIRKELEATTPYSPQEIEELLANVRVDPVEVARMQAQQEAHTGRPCQQKYFGRTVFYYDNIWARLCSRVWFLNRVCPISRQFLIVPEQLYISRRMWYDVSVPNWYGGPRGREGTAMTELILYDVPLKALRPKIAAAAVLFDRQPEVSVSGVFTDEKGELAFLNYGLYPIDATVAFRRYIPVKIEKEYVRLTPENEMLLKVKFS